MCRYPANRQGHFSALCAGEGAAEPRVWEALGLPPADHSGFLPVPLADETLAPLPVLFPPQGGGGGGDEGGGGDGALVRRYLDVVATAPLRLPGASEGDAGRAVAVARLRVPPRDGSEEENPAAAYYEALWKRRLKAAEDAARAFDGEKVASAPSASRENSAMEID